LRYLFRFAYGALLLLLMYSSVFLCCWYFLVLFVNDSEYSESAGKNLFSLS